MKAGEYRGKFSALIFEKKKMARLESRRGQGYLVYDQYWTAIVAAYGRYFLTNTKFDLSSCVNIALVKPVTNSANDVNETLIVCSRTVLARDRYIWNAIFLA